MALTRKTGLLVLLAGLLVALATGLLTPVQKCAQTCTLEIGTPFLVLMAASLGAVLVGLLLLARGEGPLDFGPRDRRAALWGLVALGAGLSLMALGMMSSTVCDFDPGAGGTACTTTYPFLRPLLVPGIALAGAGFVLGLYVSALAVLSRLQLNASR